MNMNLSRLLLPVLILSPLLTVAASAAPGTVVYEPRDGPGRGKHVVHALAEVVHLSSVAQGLQMGLRILDGSHAHQFSVGNGDRPNVCHVSRALDKRSVCPRIYARSKAGMAG